ncbi:MAG: hypothetical protein S4CHLAM45_14190 [Chlamydiales bacterium]|nr:hypothetical protein [Chlamydiales bacterium]MCH9620072.1 hypothetical protein [Chlamydiales bacterium]MCH9623509.1 hypothetical protein [Chlamydiales bacterium]
MRLPKKLTEALEGMDLKELEKASEELTAHYLDRKWKLTYKQKLAYVLCRMPATLAVLESLHLNYSTLLDLGAGPGTASLLFGDKVTSVEQDPDFIKLSKLLDSQGSWINEDFRKASLTPHDALLFSYSLGEVWPLSLKPYWELAKEALVIVEPGTPRGYQTILEARDQLIALGGYVAAPCPHNNSCPLIKPDWCHFGVNVPRSQLHRRLKKGSMSYEEEKFSYLIVTRQKHQGNARILIKPDKHPGHVKLKLCTERGVEWKTISKKEGKLYKLTRKKRWGETV